mgnify:CR=1 FL=1
MLYRVLGSGGPVLYRCTWYWRSHVIPLFLVVEVLCYSGVLGRWRSHVIRVYLVVEVPCYSCVLGSGVSCYTEYLVVEVLCYIGVLGSGGLMLYMYLCTCLLRSCVM